MPTDKRLRQKEREQAARAARAAEQAKAKRRRSIITIVVAIVAVFAFAFLYSVIQGGGDDEAAPTTTVPTETTEPPEPIECPPEDGSAERRIDFPAPPPDCLVEGASYEAIFETDAGDIRVELDAEAMPGTVNNFVYLARYGFYDGTELFRSNTDIDILQGGAPLTNDGSDDSPGYYIPDEGSGMFNYSPGDLVMARIGPPDTSGAQFFFSTGPGTARLSPGTYLLFGRTVEGLDVLEAIMETHVDGEGELPGEGAPDPKPVVNSVRIVQS